MTNLCALVGKTTYKGNQGMLLKLLGPSTLKPFRFSSPMRFGFYFRVNLLTMEAQNSHEFELQL